MIFTIFEKLLLAIALGSTFLTPLVSIQDTGKGFFKLSYGISFACLTLAGISNFSLWPYLLIALFTLLLAYLFLEQKRTHFFFLSISILATVAGIFYESSLWHAIPLLLVPALFLGSCNFAMVFGHWYLVVPKLSEKPLARVLKISLFFLGIQIVALLSYYILTPRPAGDQNFALIIDLLLLLWGLVIPSVLGIFAWKLVKMRSIQSATGLLYIMVFFSLIGGPVTWYRFFPLWTLKA